MAELNPLPVDKRHADFRRFVETECMACVIEVAGFDWTKPGDEEKSGEVYIGLVTSHEERPVWRVRFRRAWRSLRGQSTGEIELMSQRDVDELIAALVDCRAALFGKPS